MLPVIFALLPLLRLCCAPGYPLAWKTRFVALGKKPLIGRLAYPAGSRDTTRVGPWMWYRNIET
jgi:hypothetical protein